MLLTPKLAFSRFSLSLCDLPSLLSLFFSTLLFFDQTVVCTRDEALNRGYRLSLDMNSRILGIAGQL